MTIEECINASLRLLNQYSIAGTIVPLTYNDQQDDINRMIDLINDAQMTIATTVRPIYATVTCKVPKPKAGEAAKEIKFTMPSDFNYASAVYFTEDNNHVKLSIDADAYKWIRDDTIAFPSDRPGTYVVEYSRFPVQYAQDVDTATELDNTIDTHVAIPYYVAALVALNDNSKAYYAMYNIWETRLSRLGNKPAHAVSTPVRDEYGFSMFRGI